MGSRCGRPTDGSTRQPIAEQLRLQPRRHARASDRWRYRSTPHRVRNTHRGDRLSFPFFLDPSWDAVVERLPIVERPTEGGEADRWDHANVHGFTGTYGDYILGKVAKVFPDLAESSAMDSTAVSPLVRPEQRADGARSG